VYRILIVEDIALTREQLAKRLLEELPGSCIVTSSNVEEGHAAIRNSQETGRLFDAAILDFKLPAQRGFNPEVDYSLEESFWKVPRGVLIVRFTAYPNQAEIQEYFRNARDTRVRKILPIDKNEEGWSEKILRELKRDIVARSMESLFGDPTSYLSRRRSVTLRLATLIREIELFWHDLEESQQQLIREYFDVPEGKDPIEVTLGGKRSGRERV
jgi:CheY-like chemotaxis protein